ncbi:MAG: winged helix DNA-binding domain-containing protein [Synergistaceae bacterium]|jgi:uncharacterized protein YcaQ|nr:winged helix DNA-binding domain-containing protein [Synergistaceae bacterium]
MISYHHLTDSASIRVDDIAEYIRSVGCIQFDPLDIVGRNPDLVLQSRCPDYRRGGVERLLYSERRLFDVWDKNMSISAVEDWPYFSRNRDFIMPHYKKFEGAVSVILDYLGENEFACSSDFDMDEKVDWYWGNQRLAKAALECMLLAGVVVVHHRKGTRRYYCLAGNFIPKDIYGMADPNTEEEDYRRWLVLRRIRGIGLLWNRGGDAWLGTLSWNGGCRNEAFASLESDGTITGVEVEGSQYPFYIASEYIQLLSSCAEDSIPEDNVRIIAPLDNIMWDRRLIQEIFGFHYKWEVYVPADKRKYGYYVLPVICGDRFVGRIEMRTDKRESVLHADSFWWEEGAANRRSLSTHIKKCLRRFAKYNLCDSVSINFKLMV